MQMLPESGGFHRHVLDLDTFQRNQIEEVLNTAETMKEILSRDIRQVPTLRGKTVALVAYDKNDTTCIAFEMAASALSANLITLQIGEQGGNTTQTYSITELARKIQSIRANVVVLQHAYAGVPYQLAEYLTSSLINAGDGSHANPAGALTDLFTIREHLERVERNKVVLMGDILCSGTARSCLWGLTRMNARVTLCAPPPLLGPTKFWKKTWPDIRITHQVEEAIEDVNVIKVLPVSTQYYADGVLPSLQEFSELYRLTNERLVRAKKHLLILAPEYLEGGILAPDFFVTHQAEIEDYVTNGIAVRMALLYLLADS